MTHSERSINEAVARDAVLELLYRAGENGLTTREMVEQAEPLLNPNDADRIPTSDRAPEPWKQAIYNVISHRGCDTSLQAEGKVDYLSHAECGRSIITEAGKSAYLAKVAAHQTVADTRAETGSRKSFSPR